MIIEQMLQLICTTLLLTSGIFVQSFCPKGCKCKEYGYCYDCEIGYHMHNGLCKSCPKNCQSCSSVNKCEKCDVGYYKDSFSCRACSTGCTECKPLNTSLQCNTGYFRNDYGCTKCTSPCKTCTSEHNCITCNDGFKLNGTYCQKCPEGYFESRNSCAPCPKECASCSKINECKKCKQGFFGKTCDQRCSSGCKENVCEQNTGKEWFVLKSNDTIILLLFVAVVGVYAIVITVALIRNRIKQRREGDFNEGSGDFSENEYEPTTSRNAINSDHMYAIPEETTSDSVSLGILENTDMLPNNNSAEDKNMYLSPVYAETKTSNEYEEVV